MPKMIRNTLAKKQKKQKLRKAAKARYGYKFQSLLLKFRESDSWNPASKVKVEYDKHYGMRYGGLTGNKFAEENAVHFLSYVPLFYRIDYWHGGKHHTIEGCVPTGTPWDGASIPSFLTGLIGSKTNEAFVLASWLHDHLVDTGITHYPESRAFYEVLKTREGKLDLPAWKEKAMYAAVYAWSLWTS